MPNKRGVQLEVLSNSQKADLIVHVFTLANFFFSVTSACSRTSNSKANYGDMKKLHGEHKEILDILKNKDQTA